MTDVLYRVCIMLGMACLISPVGNFQERTWPSMSFRCGVYFHLEGKAQGTTYAIKYGYPDEVLNRGRVDSIFQVIDRSLSLYDTGSLISRFNRSHDGIEADSHLLKMVSLSAAFHAMSDGFFDITIKPVSALWGFGPDGRDGTPSKMDIRKAMRHTGMKLIFTEGKQIKKKDPRVQIDCNGIAQGYTVDIIADVLESHGVRDYLVELGGEIRMNGVNEEGEPWTIGIESLPGGQQSYGIAQTIRPGTGAVTSSGSYRNRKFSDGKMVSHIINPKTGYPVSNGMVSVTVWARDATTADAIDNILMVLGPDRIKPFLEAQPGPEAYWQFQQEGKGIVYSATPGLLKMMDR